MPRPSKKAISKGISSELLRIQLQGMAEQIAADLSGMDATKSKELLSDFVSDLFLAVAEQTKRQERLQKQAEGIAEAKARGVRFGRPEAALPVNFSEIHQSWRAGKLTLSQAAEACGMPKSSFYDAAVRRERTTDCAV